MSSATQREVNVEILGNERDARRALHEATLTGLRRKPKELPTVWLYDERGSQLYEEITRLPEYYLPRREAEILRGRADAIAQRTQARTLVELGSGGARNTRFLLGALEAGGMLERFVPLDVSEQALRASAEAIAAAYPQISVHALVGDFERDLDVLPREGPRLIALLGSTIGNLDPRRRERFLTTLAGQLDESDALLFGLDLVKEPARLESAYNDSAGVTEAFVRNALTAVNRELGATFEQGRFVYEARWNPEREWMEIGLRARSAHKVSIPRLELDLELERGELLRVEVSAKFRRERFAVEARRAGLSLESWWPDRGNQFAVALLERDGG
jgi:L-histidine Nalpha-methyltransferase